MDITRMNKGPRMSQIVIHGETIYLAGQISGDLDADTAGQTANILAKIDAHLAEAGSDKSRLLSATIFLADIRDFAAMNKEWDGWVDTENPPARATVQALLARPEVRVEICVIAAK